MKYKNIPMFHPYDGCKKKILKNIKETLDTKWWGQGPLVDKFEQEFGKKFGYKYPLFVNSGTSALELAYHLVGLKPGDEVIVPVLNCLQADSRVLLPNDKTRKIKDLVKEKYSGEVVSVNPKTGEIQNKKVVNWYQSQLGDRKLLRVSTENNNISAVTKKGVWVTNDHEFLTRHSGYIRADNLTHNKVITPDVDLQTIYPALNKKQYDFVIGSLLGDATIQKSSGKKSKLGRFSFGHCIEQEEWGDIKARALSGFNISKYYREPYKQTGKTVNWQTSYSPQWGGIRHVLYNSRKHIPKFINEKFFTPLMLATWYLDDGSRTKNSAFIFSMSFTKKENEYLANCFKKIDINAKVYYRKSDNKYYLYIGNGNNKENSANRFFKMIAPYVPTTMRYKLPEQIRNEISYNPELWNLGTAERFCDRSIVENKEIPSYLEKNTVYCIEVEDNHNFIVNGLILKNCTAGQTGLLRRGVKIVFADINKNDFTLSFEDMVSKISSKTKAVVAVALGGIDIDRRIYSHLRKHNIPLILDAAQHHEPKELQADYVCYSFQAIKHITTCDGGMLCLKNKATHRRAKLIRWFGIDRDLKQRHNYQAWERRKMTFDIEEAGYKMQPTDIDACFGLAALPDIDKIIKQHRDLAIEYLKQLEPLDKVNVVVGGSCWLFGILIEERDELAEYLKRFNIDTNMVHLRNDIFAVFGGKRLDLPNMDWIESRYLYLPLNPHVTKKDVKFICKKIKEFYGNRG